MRRVLNIVTGIGLCTALMLGTAGSEAAPPTKAPAPYAAKMNKKFADPNANIDEFVQRFESEARDVFAKRQAITRAVALKPGDCVADIGAGTGLFTFLFAEQVGPSGTVYAVDIGPAFVKYIAEQAKRRGLERIVKTVLNTPNSAELPARSIDVAFLCDTYHHFEQPEKMLASIHRALRPGGRLVVVDFDLRGGDREYVVQRAVRRKRSITRRLRRPVSSGLKPGTRPRSRTISMPSFAGAQLSRRPRRTCRGTNECDAPVRRNLGGVRMPEFLETTVDKFIFRVATDRLYSSDGVWVLKTDGGQRGLG